MSDQIQAKPVMKKELTIPSDPNEMPQVEAFIEEVKSELEFKDDVYGNVMVAITEAVNNCIYHGNRNDNSKHVRICCESISLYRIRVTVEDEGEGFDYDNLPDPTAPENIENPGGRGVFLMKHLADGIEFQDEGRLVEMIFNI